MYRALTRDIEVVVEPFYLEEQSDPDDDRYVWGYRIVISNNSVLTVRLVNRYWHITDQNGQVDEVTGPGVVGEQPRLKPGDTYEYSSGCPLDTPSGMMFGHYQMETDEGETVRRRHPGLFAGYAGPAAHAELEQIADPLYLFVFTSASIASATVRLFGVGADFRRLEAIGRRAEFAGDRDLAVILGSLRFRRRKSPSARP